MHALQLIGIDLRKLGRSDEAFVDYDKALAIVQRLAGDHPDRPDMRNELEKAAGTMGGLAFELLRPKKFEKSLDASNRAIAAAPDLVWLYAHRAHALMFLGRVGEARTLYLAHRGKKIQDDMIWEDVIREEFATLRKAGLTNPLMDEIERIFAKKH